jgi:hypothetical protein
MRVSSLAAGLELEPGTAPPVLLRRKQGRTPQGPDLTALRRLVLAYLTLLGPATPVEAAGYLEARRAELMAAWPEDGLVEVRLDGRQAWVPEPQLELLNAPPAPDPIRLLGGFDPYLQARDRDLIVPDKAAQKALWPVLGRPGALLVDGEIAGLWRPRSSGRKLRLTVEAFAPLPPSVWAQVEAEAERVAAVRGAAEVSVNRTG